MTKLGVKINQSSAGMGVFLQTQSVDGLCRVIGSALAVRLAKVQLAKRRFSRSERGQLWTGSTTTSLLP